MGKSFDSFPSRPPSSLIDSRRGRRQIATLCASLLLKEKKRGLGCWLILTLFLIPRSLFDVRRLELTGSQRNETGQTLHLLRRCLHLNPHHREALHLLHWLDEDEVQGTAAASGARSISHYMRTANVEKAKIVGSFSAHSNPPTAAGSTTATQQPPANQQQEQHWITANRFQQMPQREESRRGDGSSTNYRWNKTAKN